MNWSFTWLIGTTSAQHYTKKDRKVISYLTGAEDSASGTGGLLEIAQVFATLPSPSHKAW